MLLKSLLHCSGIIICLAIYPSFALAEYWVSNTGSASWPNCGGAVALSGSSACSLATANANAHAGDTVYLRAGTYGTGINPSNSGTSSARITFITHNAEAVRFTGTINAVNINSKSYITINGIKADAVTYYVYLAVNSNNIWVQNCTFSNLNTVSGWPTGIFFADGSHHNRISNSSIGQAGKESFYSGSYQDAGGTIVFGDGTTVPPQQSHYNLIENNILYSGGHHVLQISGSNNIIRNNKFYNQDWFTCSRAETNYKCGNRNLIIDFDTTSLTSSTIRNLIENNDFTFNGTPPDQTSSSGASIRDPNTIVRRNRFYYNQNGMNMYSDSAGGYKTDGSRVYHNVFYHNGFTTAPALGVDGRYRTGFLFDDVIPNDANKITNVTLKNNIFYDNQYADIFFYYTDRTALTILGNFYKNASYNSTTVAALPGNTATSANPQFLSISGTLTPGDFNLYDFHLLPTSPAINAGAFLTTSTNSGNNSTVLAVADANYFSDGYGLVDGDQIQLQGQTQTARIVSINYTNNQLTLNTPLTWSAGQGVSQPYSGVAPDIGAYEVSSQEAPSSPNNLRIN